MKLYLYLMLSVILMSPSCDNTEKGTTEQKQEQKGKKEEVVKKEPTQQEPANERIVEIITDLGSMTIRLYNETPKHRDNFIKLASEGKLNGSIFHRIIKGFMIQGGGAPSSGGQKDIGDPVPAEFIPKYFHKKGALAAARMGDNVNPKKNSSGSQFYIVQGRVFSEQELTQIEQSRVGLRITPEQREVYKTIGGYPPLDGQYTVFGEVTSDLTVIDKIASVETNKQGLLRDRPIKDIIMTVKVVQ